jgi:hypothetical protein
MKQKFAAGTVIAILFFNFGLQIFAFDAKINLSQSNVSVDDYFTLQIEVQMDD